jgi:hypothetical protein
MEKKEFKKKFPKLAEEVELGKGKSDIQFEVEPPTPRRKFAGYSPDIIDFLRRCDSDEDALEIIDYMEKRGEIDEKYAVFLRKQLEEEGLRSFGEKKTPGYYEREG